jgi:sugar/nucleoside kinase (ribokinase family)
LLRPEELPRATIESAEVFIYGSVTLTAESRAAGLQAARWARQAGHHVIFDVNLRPLLWPDLDVARQRIWEGVATANVVKLNDLELEFLTGTAELDAGSRQLLGQGVELCCVSLGADGAYFNNRAASDHVPAFAVEVVDTTGSGDAFVAGLALRLSDLREPLANLDADTLRRIVAFANACGALAATRRGAMSALPSLDAVERLLGTQ